jgi:hypothetical protein
MSINLIPENDLRAALRPHRVDPQHFETAVRQRLQLLQAQSASDLFVRLSPFAKAAAALLPLEVLAGCQVQSATTKAAPVGGLCKLLSYLAFPAISLFILLGATIFSFLKIRRIQEQSTAGLGDQQAVRESIQLWWRQHRLGASSVFAVSMVLMLLGATSLLFLFYLISFGLLLFVLSSFAKVGIGNRDVIGRTCGMGLMFLGQAAVSAGIGSQEIHFLDQNLVSVVFLSGVLILLPCLFANRQVNTESLKKPTPVPRWFWIFYVAFVFVQLGFIGWTWSFGHMSLHHRLRITAILAIGALAPAAAVLFHQWMPKRGQPNPLQRGPALLIIVLLIPLMAWNTRSLLWPATPERIKRYVESFDHAPFSSASWSNWEIPARWTIDAQLQPDLSKPRSLLAVELAGEQNPYVLSSAMRVGLITPDKLGQLKNYDRQRRYLFTQTPGVQPLAVHLGQYDWVVRAAVLKNDLSPSERDLLEQRLLATVEGVSADQYATLEQALRAIQLLSIIGKPIDRDQYRSQFHELLRTFHHTSGGWGRVNGGFRSYRNINAGDLNATAHAVDLMEIFGAPDDLNLNWARSFLANGRSKFGDQKWIAAVTLERFSALPSAPRPSWLDYLYHERTLLAAIALVGLCLYATYTSPRRKALLSANQPCPA